jgi:hypothetical protein
MANTRNKTLFLEIEGVLHHRTATIAQFLCRVPTLEAAIGDAVVDIVISSKWRLENPLDKLVSGFPPSLRSRVVGVTGKEIDATLRAAEGDRGLLQGARGSRRGGHWTPTPSATPRAARNSSCAAAPWASPVRRPRR